MQEGEILYFSIKTNLILIISMLYSTSSLAKSWIQPAIVSKSQGKTVISSSVNCGAEQIGYIIERSSHKKGTYQIGAVFRAHRKFCASLPKQVSTTLQSVELKGQFTPTQTQIYKNLRLKPTKVLSAGKTKDGLVRITYTACSKAHKLTFSESKKGQLRIGILEWQNKSRKKCKLRKFKQTLPIVSSDKPKALFSKSSLPKHELKTITIKSFRKYPKTISVDYLRSCNMKPVGLTAKKISKKLSLSLLVSIDRSVKCLVKKKRPATYIINRKNIYYGKKLKKEKKSKGKLIAIGKNHKSKICRTKNNQYILNEKGEISGYVVPAKNICRFKKKSIVRKSFQNNRI